MPTAYVLVTASSGDVDRLKPAIEAADEVVEHVSVVAGDVDYVVKTQIDDPAELKTVATTVHELDGIENTQTYIAKD
ncbi:Lrp/AsnC ligand binding domain-containing protein [Halobellus clavatus]|jgi:DNA-binding Lrp family transcriptional regulator|uniref:AsnC family protein n=1 Tax=Halobellus clavatus TaxID=660517 RepID=A0A1H3KF13_9EURY|nr:Lrp/AsnC ligand binding domain-containing protein [Halobellus clavatus]SDY50737.1 AsnC family protein [Halobellus clavatus]